MRKYIIVLAVLVFSLGVASGYALKRPVVIEKEVNVPYLDLTAPKEEQIEQLHSWASIWHLKVIDLKEYNQKMAELEKVGHIQWQNGYEAGYKAGRQY